MTAEERFWNKVDKTNYCWNWIGAKQYSGYGRFWTGQKLTGAHQYSYELHKGRQPCGFLVMHKCDNTSCVNPDHLNLGTYSDNNRDRSSKGRNRSKDTYSKGALADASKLTQQEADSIRNLYVPRKYSAERLAGEFGVSKTTVLAIVNNKRYVE